MTAGVSITIAAAVGLTLAESALRFHRWRFAPLRLRALYGGGLLNREAIQAVTEIHQRVERLGAKSFSELFALYSQASGRSIDEIEQLFGFQMSWRQLRRQPLVLRNHLRWHVGLVPKPSQRLRTATISNDGPRATGKAPVDSSPNVKRVLLTGGSVAYGYGATSDETTVAGRVQEYLNAMDPRDDVSWEVVNHAFPAATSFQELIGVLQFVDMTSAPHYIVSLSGCNDVEQQFGSAEASVSALAQGYTNSLERRGSVASVILVVLRRLVLFEACSRFARAYAQWPGLDVSGSDESSGSSRSRSNEIDQPDIYPLW